MNRRSVLLVVGFAFLVNCTGQNSQPPAGQNGQPPAGQPPSAQTRTEASMKGRWDLGPLSQIPSVHMMVTPTGKVMFYPGNQINGDDPRLWDPTTNTITRLSKAGYDIFCSGHAFMADGNIFVPGGTLLTPFDGLPYASIYDPFTDTWTKLPDMNAARWYPTTTTLENGEMLVMTGTIDLVQMENPLPQIWEPSSNTWRDLTSAMKKVYNYSWTFLAPWDHGNVIVVGPQKATELLNVSGTGSWTQPTAFNYPDIRDYGSAVMWDPWDIMIAGGGQPPTDTAEVLDMSNPSKLVWKPTGSMAFPRRHLNLTLLPDDNVLATGGTSGDGFNDTSKPVYPSEMWNPYTGLWTTMASQEVGRFYHSSAVLLPDGRVFSHGGDFTYQTEIYSPPYLFRGPRPTITSAPAHVDYGQSFFVETPEAASIFNVRLIRLGAATHAFDQNQRLVRLDFTKTTTGLNITAPEYPSKAPPGHYMLFILTLTDDGLVPSVAKIIHVGAVGAPPPPVPGPDTDGDRTPDAADQCPTQPGPASNSGCPVAPPPPPSVEMFTLTVTKTGTGSGTVELTSYDKSLPKGAVVGIIATPTNGSTFAGWSGACSGTGTCAVTMTADLTVTAQFN